MLAAKIVWAAAIVNLIVLFTALAGMLSIAYLDVANGLMMIAGVSLMAMSEVEDLMLVSFFSLHTFTAISSSRPDELVHTGQPSILFSSIP